MNTISVVLARTFTMAFRVTAAARPLKTIRTVLPIGVLLCVSALHAAELKLGSLFQDHMVLQRGMAVPVWGWAEPGAEVSVTFAPRAGSGQPGQKKTTVAAMDGRWEVKLEPLEASAESRVLQCTASTKETITVEDVLVGEVWICSGQSNMDWPVKALGDRYTEELAAANDVELRLASVKPLYAARPLEHTATSWQRCTSEQALEFSAVGLFFGLKLREELKVPIGLVESARGGSPVEAWMSAETLREGFPEFNDTLDSFAAIIDKTGGVFDHRKKSKVHGIIQRTPTVFYNANIRPLIPYGIRGVIWYQGESNVGRSEQYSRLFPAMIQQWRSEWGQGAFPFYYVQIAPCGYGEKPAALLREAQLQALAVPHTGMAVIMDLGEERNIHPVEKKPVGERLALLALAHDYGQTSLQYSGPVCANHAVEGGSIRLHFEHVGGGLSTRDGKALTHFTIAGEDKQFVEAVAAIEGDTIVVSSPDVEKPVAVRFAFGNADIPNLINKAGLPASSFRIDTWSLQ